MADLSPADIAAIVAALQLPKVRINELPAYNVYGELSVGDRMPVWMADYNKTAWAPMTALRTFFLTGGGISSPPVLNGNSIVVKVTSLEAGGTIYSIPSLAGQNFILRRTVMGALNSFDEYEILDAGGFELTTPGDKLFLDERFELQLITSAASTGGVPGVGSSGGSLNGVKTISNNTTLGPSDIGKLMQIRAGSSAITIVLPAIETIPANSEIKFEANIGNIKQATIVTSGGQFIYFQNTALSSLHIGLSEQITLYRGEDGYYVLPGANGNWLSVGDTTWKHSLGLNEIILDGSSVSRSDYPRLWAYAQTLSASIVSEDDWNFLDSDGRQINRGCFSYGNGTTTFRLPNLLNMFVRGLKSLSGSDPDRPSNKAGGYQADDNREHDHGLQYYRNDTQGGNQQETYYLDNNTSATALAPNAYKTAKSGSESRGKNIGLLPIMKC